MIFVISMLAHEFKMITNLSLLQQVIAGVGIVGLLFILLVFYLTANPNFKNIDRLSYKGKGDLK